MDKAWVEECLERRAHARKEKDFAAADAVREELATKGVEIFDTPTGSSWRLSK